MSITVFFCEWDGKQPDSHELLRLALEQYLGESQTILVEKTEHGKPYFADLPHVKFSISHSEIFWACAFGDADVGLDLQGEYKKNGEKLARRFFHQEEIAWLEKKGFAQFSRVWAHKESYVKFSGEGLTRGLDYFSVVPWLEGNGVRDAETGICQREIPFREGFWMVLTSGAPQEIEVRQFFS